MNRFDRNSPASETSSAPATQPNKHNTMTDDRTNRTDDQTSNTTDRTAYAGRFSQRMKEMDHTSPVEGPNRTFERNNEGRPAKTDGGRPPEDEKRATDEGARATDEADTETRTADEGARATDEADTETRTTDEADTETRATDEEADEEENRRFRQKMKEMDHSSPVEGPNRTFARGNEDQSVPR